MLRQDGVAEESLVIGMVKIYKRKLDRKKGERCL